MDITLTQRMAVAGAGANLEEVRTQRLVPVIRVDYFSVDSLQCCALINAFSPGSLIFCIVLTLFILTFHFARLLPNSANTNFASARFSIELGEVQ